MEDSFSHCKVSHSLTFTFWGLWLGLRGTSSEVRVTEKYGVGSSPQLLRVYNDHGSTEYEVMIEKHPEIGASLS